MSLSKLQKEFTALLPSLINKAIQLGYEPRLRDAYRDPRVHGVIGVRRSYSHPKSAHKIGLAVDLLLDRNGEYLELTEDYRQLGEWWEKQHPRAKWGGRFNDGNHFSFNAPEYGGVM